jgi:hypothetical protein
LWLKVSLETSLFYVPGCVLFASPERQRLSQESRMFIWFALRSLRIKTNRELSELLRISAQNRWLKRRMTSQPLCAEENITIHGEQIKYTRSGESEFDFCLVRTSTESEILHVYFFSISPLLRPEVLRGEQIKHSLKKCFFYAHANEVVLNVVV